MCDLKNVTFGAKHSFFQCLVNKLCVIDQFVSSSSTSTNLLLYSGPPAWKEVHTAPIICLFTDCLTTQTSVFHCVITWNQVKDSLWPWLLIHGGVNVLPCLRCAEGRSEFALLSERGIIDGGGEGRGLEWVCHSPFTKSMSRSGAGPLFLNLKPYDTHILQCSSITGRWRPLLLRNPAPFSITFSTLCERQSFPCT